MFYRRTHCAGSPLMNVHNLTVQVRTQINLRNPHKSFILYSLCHNPGLRIKVFLFPCKYPGFRYSHQPESRLYISHEGDEPLDSRQLVFAAHIAHVDGVGEGFTGDQGADTDLVAVDGVNVSHKCNPKPLCHKGGNSFSSGDSQMKFGAIPCSLKKLRVYLPRPE